MPFCPLGKRRNKKKLFHYIRMQIMKENRLKTYCGTECTLVHTETSSLLETSFPSQHKPGKHGTGPSSAKQGMLWEDEEDEDEEDGFSAWGE